MPWTLFMILLLGTENQGLGIKPSTNLSSTNLSSTNLSGANLSGAKLFSADHVSKIHIRMGRKSFEELRRQTRTVGHGYAKDLFGPPPKSPFTWFHASLSVDGKTIGEVGVRKKGFMGSLSSKRPSLKINTGKYHKDLRVDGMKRLVLNNAIEGPSPFRQCLAYYIFLLADYPAPRCGYAHVWVNQEDLGLYVLLEHVDKHMLARYFKDPTGALFEGTGSDFRPRWVGTFEPKNKAAREHPEVLEKLVKVMAQHGQRLLDSLGRLIDLNSFYTFWALESLVGHEDGYNASTNNFFVYLDPASGLLYFIPWGMDKVMAYADRVVSSDPLIALTGSVISCRLSGIPEAMSAYRQRLSMLLKEVWDTKQLVLRLRTLHELTGPEILSVQRKNLKYSFSRLMDFVRNRSRVLKRALRNKEREPPARLLDAPTWRIPATHRHGPE